MISLESKYKLRELYNRTCSLCEKVEDSGFWPYSGEVQMKDTLFCDLCRFCHYLAASDGIITQSEVAFLDTVLGLDLSIDETIGYINENNIYSEEFESTVPLIIQGAVLAEQKILKHTGNAVNITDLVYELFAQIGKSFMNCDDIDDSEVRDFKIYMGNIESYLHQEKINSVPYEECNCKGESKQIEAADNNRTKSPVINPKYEKYYSELLIAGWSGNTKAQIELGLLFLRGEIVEKDEFNSYLWFKRAAENGDVEGQYNLGVCYAKGTGVEQNREKALEWYETAANQGLSIAQYDTAMCYIAGLGTARDELRGTFWMKKAAESGDVDAQCFLGNCYFSGLGGVKQDYYTSYSWYSKAAKQNSGEAYYWLGTLLENGYVRTGSPDNELWQVVESYYNSAIKLGCEKGKDGLESLKLRKAIKRSLFAARFEEENRAANEDTNQCYSGRSRADAYGSYNLSDEINEDDYESGDYEADSYEYDDDGFSRKE